MKSDWITFWRDFIDLIYLQQLLNSVSVNIRKISIIQYSAHWMCFFPYFREIFGLSTWFDIIILIHCYTRFIYVFMWLYIIYIVHKNVCEVIINLHFGRYLNNLKCYKIKLNDIIHSQCVLKKEVTIQRYYIKAHINDKIRFYRVNCILQIALREKKH